MAVMAQSVKLNNPNLKNQYLLLAKEQVELSASDFTTVAVAANCDYQLTTSDSWLVARKMLNGNAAIFGLTNMDLSERQGTVTFTSADGSIVRVLQVVQEGDKSVNELVTEEQVKVSSVSASESMSGNPATYLTDGNFNTIYHSTYSGSGSTTKFPVNLTFTFTGSPDIDYFVYTPRQDGNDNGNFKEVEVWTRSNGESAYSKYDEYNFGGSGSATMIEFEGGLKAVKNIQLRVKSGQNNFVSGAEVQFFKKMSDDPSFAVFGDDAWTTLKPGTTQADVDAVPNNFCRHLAQQLLDGTYDTNYRVTTHECKYSPQALSDMWNAPGKYYDQCEGVTGIHVPAGSQMNVAVSGIANGKGVALKVVAWYTGEDGGPHTSQYALHNGLNRLTYDYNWDGIAYVTYFDYDNPDAYSPVTVHFINGEQNGYLSPDKTNDEMHQICANAKNKCMDVLGSKVHSVWTAKGLHDYCKTSTDAAKGYRQYLNLLDTLVKWEHDVLGFTKYKRVPKNHTMAYVNWTGYMFQSGFGVSFHQNQESRVLNCKTLMYNDYDAVWGLSHEWGHQHQMTPYFCWAGMTEVTNNVNSYYNVTRMGYNRGYSHGAEPGDGLVIYNGEPTGILSANDQTVYTKQKNTRGSAYRARNNYSWNSKLLALCTAMKDSTWTDKEKNGPLSFDYTNYGTVRPFVALMEYAVINLGLKDFSADLYEALRQTDNENGSQIEKSGAVDKYELLASAQNYNKNGKLAQFQKDYSNSTWVKNNYITTSHCDRWENSVPFIFNFIRKTSRLTGYNLFPYFEKCGMLRQVAMRIDDYGLKWYLMTEDMYDEFKADMESMGLKTCDDAMVKAILTQSTPTFSRPPIPN